MITELLNKIINYDPDAPTTDKVNNLNDLLAKFIAFLEKVMGI